MKKDRPDKVGFILDLTPGDAIGMHEHLLMQVWEVSENALQTQKARVAIRKAHAEGLHVSTIPLNASEGTLIPPSQS